MICSRLRCAFILFAVAMTGCSHSPPTTMLTLDALAPPQGPALLYRGPPIAIPAVHVPAVLDRSEFVEQTSAGVVKVDDFARWAAPVGTLARDTLVRDLMARLPSGAVLPPGSSTSLRHRTIDVTILSFSNTAQGGHLQAAWRTVPDGAVQQIDEDAQSSGSGPPASARMVSVLIAQLADAIAKDMTMVSASRPPS